MRLWHRTEPGAWLLILSSLLGSIPVGFLVVALPIYLDHIGLHPRLIGTLFTISGIASAVMLVIFGILADRYGRKPFVMIGNALPVVSYLILATTQSKPLLMVASAIGGIGLAGGMSGALVTSGYNALLSEKSDPDVRTTIFSVSETAWTIAAFVGSLLAALPVLLESRLGISYMHAYHIAFLLMVGLGLLATLAVLPIRESKAFIVEHQHWLPRASGRRIALLAVVLGMLGLGLGFIVQLLPLWFHLRFGVSEAFLGPWYGIGQLLSVSGLMAAPVLSRRMGPVRYTVVAQGIGSLLLSVMAFAPNAWVAVALYTGRQILMNSSWPVQQAYIMDVVDPGERATASSLTYAAWSVASALTPPIGGALLGAGMYALPFLLGAVCYAVSIGVFFSFFRHVPPLGRQQTSAPYAAAAE